MTQRTTTQTINEVVQFLTKNPGYMKWGKEKLASKLDCTVEEIAVAKEWIKLGMEEEVESITVKEEIVEEKEISMPNILILDIETSPLKAYVWRLWKQDIYLDQLISDWFCISWAAKWLNHPETMSDVLTPDEIKNEDDSRIMKGLWNLLNDADIVIAHNGCVEKNTPILMKDFTWKPAGELQIGDEIIAFEEGLSPESNLRDSEGNWNNPLKRARNLKTGVVTHNKITKTTSVRVKFTNGYSLITTPNHPWLMKTSKDNFLKWRNSEDLKAGDRVIRITRPWEKNISYEGAWLSGFIEGEGSLIKKNDVPTAIQWCQRPTIVKETADKYANILDIKRFDYIPSTNWGLGKGDCVYTNTVGGKYEVFKWLGSLNLKRLQTHIDYNNLGGLYGQNQETNEQETYYVESVEACKDHEIALLSTSTKTYIADGFAMHNSSFDIPRIKARFIINHLPPTSFYHQIDTKLVAQKEFGFSSNKLDALARYFQLPHKLHTGFELWSKCLDGDQESLNYMEKYNRYDVELLENIYLVLRPWIKNHPNVTLYSDEAPNRCPSCGGSILHKEDFYYTSVGKFQVYRCQKCGALSRDRKAIKRGVVTSNLSLGK